jgi:haloacetate dehalogenase
MDHRTVVVNDVRIHYVIAGAGPPVFLLHGFPEFWYAWRHQIPVLAQSYTVVAPDLRGYGYSGKPGTGYDKRTMAADVRELARSLGFAEFAVVGHDRGARVGLRLAKDHPDVVERLAVLDNVPTREVFRTMDAEKARGQWWFLVNQVEHLPEALIAGREEVWLRHFFTEWCFDPQVLTPADVAEYVRAYRQPGAVTGACHDYRAGAEDVAQDDEDADRKLSCPVLALWGADFAWVGGAFDVAAIWAELADDLRAVELQRCAHLPHEEQPGEVNRHLLEFLAGNRAAGDG